MKKIYSSPLTEVVKINTEMMICQSMLNVIDGNPDQILTRDDSDFDFGFDSGNEFDLNFDKNEGLW